MTCVRNIYNQLSPVPVRLEVEIQRENTALKRATKASLSGLVPFAIYDLEGDIFVGRSRMETNDAKLI